MIKISFSSSFKKAYKKRIKEQRELETRFWEKLKLFTHDPFDRSLRTHKLSGRLRDLWGFSVSYDLRVVFYFVDETKAVFVDIGKHEEVY
jgi:addiction module RelE/StbE family toxin